jgi:Trypsin-like peptidase domain
MDLAFLRLHPTNEEQLSYIWRCPRLQLLPPSVGTVVSAFGYHSSHTEIDHTSRRIRITTNPSTSQGVVQEVHHYKRDSVILPFRCFRTDSRFDRGMSGGPVFSSAGALCGIICTNFQVSAPDHDEHHTSYVTTLWPSMVIKVAFNRSGYPQDVYYPAFELARGGFIKAVDWERFHYEYDETTGIAMIGAPIS